MKAITKKRQPIIAQAEGRVLEIGFGSGHNLAFYDSSKVTHLWGLEPSDGMRQLAEPKTQSLRFPFEFLDLPGEEVPLDDSSVDMVVSTFTFCSIAKLDDVFVQLRRVLKPAGRLLFLEHGLSPDDKVAKWQHRLEPVWKKIADGCHLTRKMDDLVLDAGFTNGGIESDYLPGFRKSWQPAMMKSAAYCYSGNCAIRQ